MKINFSKRSIYATLAYLLLLTVLRRELGGTLLLGGIGGFLFLPVLKQLIALDSRNGMVESILFQIPLSLLSFYAASSSTDEFGQGFILVLFLQTLLLYKKDWFWPVKGGVSNLVSSSYQILTILIFFYSSLLLL